MADRLEQLKKLHALEPDDTFITYALAMEYIKIGEHEQAIQWLDQTLELDPTYAYAYYQKALALQHLDDIEQAKTVVAAGIEQAQKIGDQKAHAELRDLLEMLE